MTNKIECTDQEVARIARNIISEDWETDILHELDEDEEAPYDAVNLCVFRCVPHELAEKVSTECNRRFKDAIDQYRVAMIEIKKKALAL